MIERDKQVTDQQKKHASEKERHEHKGKEKHTQDQQQAGMSTDPEAMKDKGYLERIEKKTSKH